ncbi:MAG TPA: hypothetical protein VL371_03115 [Gemmataceae bacterium]|jgi:hypothetical protein|nr:hypothetical protein [Gemmataceae bacterium]
MLPADFVHELRTSWLPNVSDAGLERVIDLLEKGSPLLVSGRFTGAAAMGCLATHIGWHDTAVGHRSDDAGILWLTRVARLNPATSHVIREWDRHGPQEWTFRADVLALLREEQTRRSARLVAPRAVVPV